MYKWGICSLYICTCMYVLFLGQVKAVAGKGSMFSLMHTLEQTQF